MLVRFELSFDALNFVERYEETNDDEWYSDEERSLFEILNSLKGVTKEISSLEELRDIIISIDECEYEMTYTIYLDDRDNSFVVLIDLA